MNFALKKLRKYCENHTSPQTAAQYELDRETNLKTLAPQMISGHLQGALLSMLTHIKQPKTILEIGTFTGYAAIAMAKGLPTDGLLHTIEANEELVYMIRKYVKKEGLEDKVQLHVGDAKEIIPTLDTDFDMVFIDAGKKDYEFYYDLVFDRLRANGLIIVDNILWSGKVTLKEHDKDTRIIHAFNEKVQQDERVENLMLPLRDGLLIARKL